MASPALRLIPGGMDSAAQVDPLRAPDSGERAALPSAPESSERDVGGVPPALAASIAAQEDASLVRRLLTGERAALEELYRRHAKFAFNLAVRLQGHAGEVEDVVHDAFLKAHAELGGLRDANAFRGWLGSIVVSQVRSRLRRGSFLRGLRLVPPDSVDLESIASPSAGPEVRAQLAQVYALLKLLPADERIAWTLRSVERHRLEEVAELVGCSLATVKRRLVRAQRFLDEHFVEPGRASSPSLHVLEEGDEL